MVRLLCVEMVTFALNLELYGLPSDYKEDLS